MNDSPQSSLQTAKGSPIKISSELRGGDDNKTDNDTSVTAGGVKDEAVRARLELFGVQLPLLNGEVKADDGTEILEAMDEEPTDTEEMAELGYADDGAEFSNQPRYDDESEDDAEAEGVYTQDQLTEIFLNSCFHADGRPK